MAFINFHDFTYICIFSYDHNNRVLSCSTSKPKFLSLWFISRQPQARCNIEEDVDVVIDAPKFVLTRPFRKYRHIGQGMHTLVVRNGQCPIDQEARGCILVIEDEVIARDRCIDSRLARAILVYFVILTVIGIGAHSGEERVPIEHDQLCAPP